MKKMTDDEINHACATEVMGWKYVVKEYSVLSLKISYAYYQPNDAPPVDYWK